MTQMTRTVVEHADLSQLGELAGSLTPVSDGISRAADSIQRTIHGLNWHGQARADATGRADSEKTQMHRVSDAVATLRTALTDGQAAMTPMVADLKSSARNLEAAGYDVADNWTVTDGYKYGLAEAFAAGDSDEQARIAELKRQRAEEARNATVRLTRLAHELEAADTACATAVRAANGEIGSIAPVAAGLLGGQAATDLQALRSGSATSEQLARLHAATTLTPEQLEALREGRPAYMSQGQFDYLKSLMRGLDGVSLQEMEDLDQRDPGELGDALRLMSMPNLQTLAGERGGVGQMPVGVRTLLQDKPTRIDTAVVGPTIQSYLDVPRLDDFRSLNGILSRSDQGLRLGADIDCGLLKQASEIGSGLGPRGSGNYYGSYDHRIDEGELRQTVDAMFHNGSGDHQAVTDFLTGNNMNVTVTPGSHYNADSHVLDLLETKWEPDELGAKSVVSWLGDSAGSAGHEGVLAGRSMSALADTMVNHSHDLMTITAGERTYTTFGQLNPELAQTIARSTTPFIGNYFDLPDSMLVSSHADRLGSVDDFSKVFGVLATDGTAGGMLVHSSSAWENYIGHEFGANPAQSGLGIPAGQLHRAVETGIDQMDRTLGENYQWNNTVDYTRRSDEIDGVLGLLQGSGVPGLSEAATIAGPSVKSLELGPPPGDPAEIKPWDSQVQNYHETHRGLTEGLPRTYTMLKPYLEDHQELVNHSWHADGGLPIDFFNENGDLDWEKASADPIRFQSFFDLTELGDKENDFTDNAGALGGGPRIDYTNHPEPDDASSGPK